MGRIEYINPGTPVAGPYSPAVKVGDLIFVSGQIPDKDSNGIGEQTISAFNKIKDLLESCGTSVNNIVRVGVYLKDISNFGKMNEAYKKFFADNGVDENYPARSTIQASPPIEGIDIEIDVIASI